MRDERADDGDEQRQRQDRRQVAERGVAQQQHHVLRRDAPPAAWPSVRISIIVSTMVRITTSVAPKLRASSWRRVESNNIVGLSKPNGLWTFELKTLSVAQAAGDEVPMRCIVLVGDAATRRLGRRRSRRCSPTRRKARRPRAARPASCCYLHRPAGVTAPRVVLASPGDGTPRRRSSRGGRRPSAQLKAADAKRVGDRLRQAPTPTRRMPRRGRSRRPTPAYVYRHTKPSADAAHRAAQVDAARRGRCEAACSKAFDAGHGHRRRRRARRASAPTGPATTARRRCSAEQAQEARQGRTA